MLWGFLIRLPHAGCLFLHRPIRQAATRKLSALGTEAPILLMCAHYKTIGLKISAHCAGHSQGAHGPHCRGPHCQKLTAKSTLQKSPRALTVETLIATPAQTIVTTQNGMCNSN